MQSTQGAEVGNRGRNWRLAALAGSIALLAVLIVGGSAQLRPNDAVAASGVPEMALTITQGGFCVDNDCYAEAGKDFMLGVDLVQVPAIGYILMQTYLDFGVYDPTASEDGAGPNTCSDGINNSRDGVRDRRDDDCATVSFVYTPRSAEFIWPDLASGAGLRQETGPGLVTHAGLTGLIPPLPVSTYTGIGIEIQLSCPATPMEAPISLLPYDDPVARTGGAYFKEGIDPYLGVIPKVDTITMHCVAPQTHPGDTDGDGCSDATENGSDPPLGGDRDWLNPWDFYDVAIAGSLPGQDGVIDLPNDYMAVSSHFSPSGGPPYDIQYDRGTWGPGGSWKNTQGPDGVIDLPNDILGVIQQLGHSCA